MPLIALSPDDPTLPHLQSRLGLGEVERAELVEFGAPGLCYWNCDAYVATHGGRVVHGWQVAAWPDLYLMLLHHAVVETPGGRLIDVTACPAPHGEATAFVRDEEMVPPRDYPIYVPNRYLPLSASPCSDAMAQANADQLNVLRRMSEIARAQGVPFDLATGPKLRMTAEVADLYQAYDRAARAVSAAEKLCREESGEASADALCHQAAAGQG